MIDIKKELANLDKSDFIKVCDLVDKIITDIWITSKQEKNKYKPNMFIHKQKCLAGGQSLTCKHSNMTCTTK